MSQLQTILHSNLRLHRRLRSQACPSTRDRSLYRDCMAVARAEEMSRLKALESTVETRSFYL